jgi:hypothetical protein
MRIRREKGWYWRRRKDLFGVRGLSKPNNCFNMLVYIYNWLVPLRITSKSFIVQCFKASHSYLRHCIKIQHKTEANALTFPSLKATWEDIPMNKLIVKQRAKKTKTLFLQQAVTIGSQKVLRLSALHASCTLPVGRLMVLISVRGWVRPGPLCGWK